MSETVSEIEKLLEALERQRKGLDDSGYSFPAYDAALKFLLEDAKKRAAAIPQPTAVPDK